MKYLKISFDWVTTLVLSQERNCSGGLQHSESVRRALPAGMKKINQFQFEVVNTAGRSLENDMISNLPSTWLKSYHKIYGGEAHIASMSGEEADGQMRGERTGWYRRVQENPCTVELESKGQIHQGIEQ